MILDLAKYTISELNDLKSSIDKEIEQKRTREKQELLAEMRKLAADRGFDYDDLIGNKDKLRKKSAAKYQNPANPTQTWSGKGRKPGWILAYLMVNQTLADIEIQND